MEGVLQQLSPPVHQ